ncbi:MAG: lipocalin family protein [Janthinobacterium lividum]
MKKLLSLSLGLVALGACKKDSETTPAGAASPTELLTAKSWHMSAYTSSFAEADAAAVTTNEYATTPACQHDDFAKFNADKSVRFDEGTTKCNTTDAQSQNSTWELSSNNTKLTLAAPQLGGFPIPYDVIVLTASTLQLRYSYTYSSNNASYTETQDVTFTAL